MKKIFTLSMVMIVVLIQAQTVTDYDGNVYDVIQIGEQFWLQQNLKSMHYSDGTVIPDVLGYENSDSLVEIYGRLYTWDAAMRNSTVPMSQGVCPDGWHLPSTEEWIVMETFLGGSNVAGGKMKVMGTDHWNPPNTGATNSSGFSCLPAGEYDTPNSVFQFLRRYAIFWTSTEVSNDKARERFLAYNSTACDIYDWHKSLNYCVKDAATGAGEKSGQDLKVYPNPVKEVLHISVPGTVNQTTISVWDGMGRKVLEQEGILAENRLIDVSAMVPGIYVLKVVTESGEYHRRFLKSSH